MTNGARMGAAALAPAVRKIGEKEMKFECSVCSYVYDEDAGGRPFTELADDWECPICGADRSYFKASRRGG